jgi:hypothetical protein
MVTHQYVFNGIQYGTLDPWDKSLLFQWRAEVNDSRVIQTTPLPTTMPTNTSNPTPANGTKPTMVPLPSQTATQTPGFGFGSVFALVSVLAIAHALYGITRKW